MDIQKLKELIDADYINVQKHPHAELYIYNYSAKAQYDRVWNEWTLACRGLILNENNEIIARPFQKFFNLGEYEKQVVPNESFEVFEKMDGSLGILYWIDNEPFIATRGSFLSMQSQKATEMLKTKYKTSLSLIDKTKTYLFEIIYPENRIVVDYGVEEKLVLLAIIDIQTGQEEELVDIGIEIVKKYDGINDIKSLKDLEVKFEEYVRIHRIVTQVSSYNIWEYLKEGQDLMPILDRVPDEFYDWVRAVHKKLIDQYADIEMIAKIDFKVLNDKKETALYFLTCKYPAIMFKMLDKKPYDHIIWKYLKPSYERPFTNKE
jgi:RNA ligase